MIIIITLHILIINIKETHRIEEIRRYCGSYTTERIVQMNKTEEKK